MVSEYGGKRKTRMSTLLPVRSHKSEISDVTRKSFCGTRVNVACTDGDNPRSNVGTYAVAASRSPPHSTGSYIQYCGKRG